MSLIQKIKVLDRVDMLTKHEKIVSSISDCISDNELVLGALLPSVNEMSHKLGYSRETIVKAYRDLKERGIISSKQGLGYFVSHNDVTQKLRLALVLYGFQSFQQEFYDRFRKCLGDQHQIDVYFHHNNLDMFQTIINNVKMKYGRYVVAPIQSPQAIEILSALPEDKLLLIDRYLYMDEQVSFVSQEFEDSLSDVFSELRERITSFNELYLYYRNDVDYPKGIHQAFLKFCDEENLTPKVKQEYETDDLMAGNFYFTIGDTDLWKLIRDIKEQQLDIGTDIGVLSHNDSLVKEIMEGGITTFSTDFRLMAEKAAEVVSERRSCHEIMPCKLIRRNSL